MAEAFDPYSEWLGIVGTERPPNHYRLLGLEPFESDVEAIGRAAVAAMAKVRRIRSGPHLADWSRILDEMAAAKACLLDPSKKEAYDAALRHPKGTAPFASNENRDGIPAAASPAPTAAPQEVDEGAEDDDLKLDPIQPFSRFKNMPSASATADATPSKNDENLGFKDDPFDRRPARRLSQADEDADAKEGYGLKSPGGSGGGPMMRGKMAFRPASEVESGYALQTDRQPPKQVKPRRKPSRSWKGPIVAGILLVALGVAAGVFNHLLESGAINLDVSGFSLSGQSSPPSTPSQNRPSPHPGPAPPGPGERVEPEPPGPASFAEAATAVRKAFRERRLTAAKKLLQTASGLAVTQAERERVERLRLLLDYLSQFWNGVGAAMGRFLPGQGVVYDHSRLTILECAENYWKTQEGDNVREYRAIALPSTVVWMIVKDYFGRDAGSKAVIAAFLAVDPKGNLGEAKDYWREAAEEGLDAEPLIKEFKEFPP